MSKKKKIKKLREELAMSQAMNAYLRAKCKFVDPILRTSINSLRKAGQVPQGDCPAVGTAFILSSAEMQYIALAALSSDPEQRRLDMETGADLGKYREKLTEHLVLAHMEEGELAECLTDEQLRELFSEGGQS